MTVGSEGDSTGRPAGRSSANRLAHLISTIFYPTFYSVPVFIILSAATAPWPEWGIVAAASILFATVASVAIVLTFTVGMEHGRLDIHDRKARLYPLLAIEPRV